MQADSHMIPNVGSLSREDCEVDLSLHPHPAPSPSDAHQMNDPDRIPISTKRRIHLPKQQAMKLFDLVANDTATIGDLQLGTLVTPANPAEKGLRDCVPQIKEEEGAKDERPHDRADKGDASNKVVITTIINRDFLNRMMGHRMMLQVHHTQLALAQHCREAENLTRGGIDENAAGDPALVVDRSSGDADADSQAPRSAQPEVPRPTVTLKDGRTVEASDINAIPSSPRRIILDSVDDTNNDQYKSMLAYDSQSAATRYSCILHYHIHSPELGVEHSDAVFRFCPAFDWNSICTLDPRAVARSRMGVGVLGEGQEGASNSQHRQVGVQGVEQNRGWLSGSVYPSPFTQLAFLRYLAALPFSRPIVVSINTPGEISNPRGVHPPYWNAITAKSTSSSRVLHDNTDPTCAADAQRWKAYHSDHARIKVLSIRGEEADENGRVGLGLAAEQILTQPADDLEGGGKAEEGAVDCDEQGCCGPSDDRPIRTEVRHDEEAAVHIREGFLGSKPITHLHLYDWRDGAALFKEQRARLMLFILRYLMLGVPEANIMAKTGDGEEVGMVLHCHAGVHRTGTLYVALRYLDALIHSRDPLAVSDLEPHLPTAGSHLLPSSAPEKFPSDKEHTIKPYAPPLPLEAPSELQDCFAAVPHLVPMIQLIDQVQEYRQYLTGENQRAMLYDMVETVQRHGVEGLVEVAKWREQDESVWAEQDVEARDGSRFRPWRSVRLERGEREVQAKYARKGVEALESEARAWTEADEAGQ